MSASVTPSSVSNAAAALPPTAPNTAAASTPRMPPELGTVTLLTFLMMLPEHHSELLGFATEHQARQRRRIRQRDRLRATQRRR